MPGNDFDSEAMLAFVSELTKRVEDLKKEIASVGEHSGVGMRKASEATEKLGQTIDRNAKSLKGMREQSGNLLGLLRGATGLGVAFYGATQAMENFARGELSMRNFAIDVGLATSEVNKLKTQLTSSGVDSSTAMQQLGSLTAKLDNIRVYGTASPVLKAIAANDPILARQLADAEKMGNRMKSVDAIVQRWNTGPRSQLFITEQLGVTPSMMRALERNQKGLVQPWEYDDKALQKYNDEWHNVITTVQNVWGASMMKMVSSTNQFVENTKKEFGGITTWLLALQKDLDLEGLQKGDKPKTIPELLGLDVWGSLKRLLSTEAHAALPTERDTLLEGADSFSQRFGDWSREKFDTEKNSNKVLQDIRDMLSEDAVSEGEIAGMGGTPAGRGGRRRGGGGGAGEGKPPTGDGKPPADGKPPTGDGKPSTAAPEDGGDKTAADTTSGDGDFPERVQAKGGKDPEAFIVHHTGGRGTVAGVQATLRQRGLGVQYVMDRDGNIVKTGGPGAANIKTGWGPLGQGLSNANIVGMEIIARNDADVTEKQKVQFAKFIAARYAETRLLGHGEVNPGHKEQDEGISARNAALAYREHQRKLAQARASMDKSLVTSGSTQNSTARVDVEFTGVPKGVTTDAELLEQGVFSTLNIKKSQAAAQPQN